MKKLYVIVRKDLSTSQQAVQAGHAVAAFLLHGQFFRRWENETLIYLGVKGLTQLTNLKRKLDFNDISYVEFREPDIGNQVTAIATESHCKYFERMNLL